MCGRYRLARGKAAFAKVFGVRPEDFEWADFQWKERYNIAPTQVVPVVTQHLMKPERLLANMRWGLVPYWADDISVGARMINARSEEAASKPAFRESLKKRRCLVPADGFYEWKKAGKTRQPFCFQLADEAVFAFAGIWDRWKDPKGQPVESFSILTTAPNVLTAEVHDRMPVILPPEHYDLWLDPGFSDTASLAELLKPFDARLMKKYPVSARVNSVVNDDAQCAEAVSELLACAEPQQLLSIARHVSAGSNSHITESRQGRHKFTTFHLTKSQGNSASSPRTALQCRSRSPNDHSSPEILFTHIWRISSGSLKLFLS
jgi:putative SOS response-associated peptidase YedK